MGSTFSGIEIGKRGLSVHQQAIQTTGHNISNADDKHYARQRINSGTVDPLYEPSLNRAHVAGQIGQGSVVESIERVRDSFLDDRVMETTTEKEYWNTKSEYLRQVETIFAEPGGITIRKQLDQFWSSWEELANYPEENAHRAVVREKAMALGSRVEDTFRKLSMLRDQSNKELESRVNMLNNLVENIRNLNGRIAKAEAMGDMPNDLYDKRDKAVEELSGLSDISVGRSDKDEFMVFIGQQILVQGTKGHKIKLEGNPAKNGFLDTYWEDNGKQVLFERGRIQALFEVRDIIMREKIDQLDSLALNVKEATNEVHRDGFGLNGKTNLDFFEVKNLSRNLRGEVDNDMDGVNDSTAIFKVTGKTKIDPTKPIGISGTLTLQQNDEKSTPVYINYRPDDTMDSVIQRINQSKAGVVAYMNQDNQLSIKAKIAEDHPSRNFMIRHLEDSGNLLSGMSGILAGSGQASAFDFKRLGEINKLQANMEDISFTPHYHPSSFMKLSPEIQNNTASIAASRGKDVGGTGDYNTPNGHKDGENALLIARALRDKPVMVENDKTVGDFYNRIISKLGTEAREAKQETETQVAVLTEYENLRQSVMGVNLDEEMANMVQFQQAYNASAKIISVYTEMLDTIINRLGA
ncbi:MAG: flagellar hook-associated protein FlgK [Leptospiraceae bacterium]|nr:flagellar hook-associated protein FlgK [Leptospiraceae bacterium]